MSSRLPIVAFDGGCGFCTWSVYFARDRVGSDVEFRPFQLMELADFGVTREQAEKSVLFIDGDHVLSGSRAVAAILRAGHRPWPWVGVVVDVPIVRPLAQVGYRLVARYRGRLPGVRPALSE